MLQVHGHLGFRESLEPNSILKIDKVNHSFCSRSKEILGRSMYVQYVALVRTTEINLSCSQLMIMSCVPFQEVAEVHCPRAFAESLGLAYDFEVFDEIPPAVVVE